jgi:hypothetical protein
MRWRERTLAAMIALLAVADAALYGGVLTHGDARAIGGLPAGALRADQRAEIDDSASLPGRYVPPQGRKHTPGGYPLPARVPFCAPDAIADTCYASNPPTSGLHMPVERVRLEDGHVLQVPPDPGVYGFVIPREAIPHIQEHAGVYVGYRCTSGCAAVDAATQVVRQELALGARVVMSPDPDLAPDTIAAASWTRVDVMSLADYSDDRLRAFIKAHSCRFDPERFCPERALN